MSTPGPPAANSGRIVTDYEAYLFGEGHWLRAWEKMGARRAEIDGADGYTFVVWAPNARRVSVVGDFNDWDGRRHMMRSLGATGLWETFVPGVNAGAVYKFEIQSQEGATFTRADPFALRAQLPPDTASITAELSGYTWRDDAWMDARRRDRDSALDRPMAIYEVHPGSWRRNPIEGNRSRSLGASLPRSSCHTSSDSASRTSS